MYRAESIGASRMVIDSLSSLLLAQKEKLESHALLHFLYSLFKMKDLTTIMTICMQRGSTSIGQGIEDAMADGVILFENVMEGNALGTRTLILKMRGTKANRKYHRVIFGEKGLALVPYVSLYPEKADNVMDK